MTEVRLVCMYLAVQKRTAVKPFIVIYAIIHKSLPMAHHYKSGRLKDTL